MSDINAALSPSAASVPLGDAAFLRAVLEAIPLFVLRLDPELRVQYINHLRAGVTLEQVIGRPVHELIAAADHPRLDEAAERALRTGETCSYVARGSRDVTEDGAAHYEVHLTPIDNGDGRRALCVVAADVSAELKRANALQQSEEKLRIAVDATGLGLWTWNLETDQIEWNQRLRDITGCEPMSSSDYVARLVHPDDRLAIRQELEAVHAARPTFAEYRIVRPDGEVRWLLPCGQIMKGENGRGTTMIGGLLDVTAQRKTAEHLRRAQKLDVIGSLTTGIAHNFNNMLAVIQPVLELALERPSQSHTQGLEDALHAAARAAELVGQLMTFAGQRRAGPPASIDLVQTIEHTVAMCQRMFESRVRIESAFEQSCAHVSGDRLSIEQVLMNLLINARDAVSELELGEPRIRVVLSEVWARPPGAEHPAEQKYFRIRIEDNGAGMSDVVKQHLFEPFFTTKKPGKGTGLGLATSYGIVRDAGGFITLESQPLQGTSFAVFLPPAPARSASTRVGAQAVSPAPRGTILVIDDEPAVRRVVELLLGARGHRVRLAADGPAGVAELEAGLHPDLILLDRSMPGWPVKLTLDEIRKRAEHVPVVFFTGQDVTSEERSQVQDVLYKPLSNEELVRSVERWLAPRPRGSQ